MAPQVLTPLQFDLAIAYAEADGMEMGILGDGTPYLTAAGLAHASGQTPSAIRCATVPRSGSGRAAVAYQRILALAAANGHHGETLYRDITIVGKPARVYSDAVCMAVLEYFAFEARSYTAHVAQRSYRLLARQSLRRFIYTRVGHNDQAVFSDSWQHLHDRMVLNPLPPDYFSIFREITDLLIAVIQAGLALDRHTVPDISVGLRWGRYWADAELDRRYGPRCKHPHRFPADQSIAQSMASPVEVQAWIYPIQALGEFRAWMRDDYLPIFLAPYLASKARGGELAAAHVDPVLAAVNDNQPIQL